MPFRWTLLGAVALVAGMASQPAGAQTALPAPVLVIPRDAIPPLPDLGVPRLVRAMIKAAVETNDKAKVAAVVEAARATNPDHSDEIAALHRAFLDEQAALAAARKERELAALRAASLFDRWEGEGQIGGFHSSGNSDDVGVTAALALRRDGIKWQHRLRGTVDYQRSRGRTSREKYFASYEPRYDINDDIFSYALAQFESNRIQGFISRYSVSGGLGVQVVESDDINLSAKLGPAFRQTDYVNQASESALGALAGLDFDWQIAEPLKLTQDTNLVAESGGSAVAIIDSATTSLKLVTGLEAKITNRVTTRLSYSYDYDSNPPPGAVSTDTQTRFSLVYGF